MSRPPAGSRRLLALVAPEEDRATVLADMDELYRLRLERDGRAPADRWYRRQTRRFLRARVTACWPGRRRAARSGRRAGNLRKPVAGPVGGSGDGLPDRILRDVRFTWRQMARQPAATLVAVSVLALGVGTSTAVFSVVDGVVMSPLPFPDPDRLVTVQEVRLESGIAAGLAPPAYRLFDRSDLRSLEGLTVISSGGQDLEGVGESDHIPVTTVGHAFFRLMGVPPRMGRGFTAGDEGAGAPPVAVLSHGFWESRFGGDPSVVGGTIRLGGELRTVVGVAAPGFDFPSGTRVWIPADLSDMEDVWGATFLDAVGRLREGAEPPDASLELTALMERVPEAAGWGARALSLHEQLTAGVRKPLIVLLGAVLLVLLVACANVGGLLLARAMGRRRELAVRRALGASRKRLVMGLLTEGLLLAGVAAVLGAALAHLTLDALLALAPMDLPRASDVGVDGRVLLFALGVTLLTGLAVGLLPALRVRVDVVDDLKEGPGSHTGAEKGSRARSLIVVAQVAISVVLLTGFALMARSFLHLMEQETGFDTDGLATVELTLPAHRYESREALLATYRELSEAVRGIPGVETAAITRNLPMGGRNLGAPVMRPGHEHIGRVVHVSATPEYFEAIGTDIVLGRPFTPADVEESRRPAVVSETLARTLFGAEDPLGREVVTLLGMDTMVVVGVAQDVRFASLDEDPRPILYRPLTDWTSRGIHLVVRSPLPPAGLFPALREAVRTVHAGQPVKEMATMSTLLGRTVARPRFYALLLAAFAGVALFLSALGFYGLLLSDVARQRREIAIRLALGAGAGRVALGIAGRGLLLTMAGACLGVAGALLSGRFIESLLFGVPPRDPRTLAGVILVLLVVSLLVTVPAVIRASRVDPVRELAS